jgi:hypothetical protein
MHQPYSHCLSFVARICRDLRFYLLACILKLVTTLPQTQPKNKISPTLSTKLPQGRTRPPMWIKLAH